MQGQKVKREKPEKRCSDFISPSPKVLLAADTDLLQSSMDSLLSSLSRLLHLWKGKASPLRRLPEVMKYWQKE